MNMEDECKFEDDAKKSLNRFVKSHGKHLACLWRFGDGDGGYVFSQIKELLMEAGFINNSKIFKKSSSKKPIKDSLRWEVFERDNFKCVLCSSKKHLTADHVYPESLGGEATLDNLQTLCRSCNSRKGKSYV